MNLSQYYIGLMEQDEAENAEKIDGIPAQVEGKAHEKANEFVEFPEDNSGFITEEDYGIIKLDKPSKEGFAAGISAAKQFVNSSDGDNTDIDLSYFDAFPKDTSGFDDVSESADDITVDPNTIPATPSEDDQFSDHEYDDDTIVSDKNVSVSDLASDDEDESFDESFTGWDDLL